jgi:hypothetical protein
MTSLAGARERMAPHAHTLLSESGSEFVSMAHTVGCGFACISRLPLLRPTELLATACTHCADRSATVYSGWADYADLNYDLAVVHLASRHSLGNFYLQRSDTYSRRQMRTAGYPGDKGTGSGMWREYCDVSDSNAADNVSCAVTCGGAVTACNALLHTPRPA